jgi:hypothetical protein
MPRAGRPGNTLVIAVSLSFRLFQTDDFELAARLFRLNSGQASEPSPPASETATTISESADPAISS